MATSLSGDDSGEERLRSESGSMQPRAYARRQAAPAASSASALVRDGAVRSRLRQWRAELSHLVAKAVADPPLCEMAADQRREFHEALLDADSSKTCEETGRQRFWPRSRTGQMGWSRSDYVRLRRTALALAVRNVVLPPASDAASPPRVIAS
jgi:hypothetical protein